MSNTAFTGPLLAGPIQNTTGVTLGIDVANVGYALTVQSVAVTQAGSIVAVATSIVIPAYSQIISVTLTESVQWAAANVSVGISSASTELASPTAAGSSYRVAFVPATAPQGTLWTNVGATDVRVWLLSSTGTGGVGLLHVTYMQQFNTTTT